MKKLLNSLRWLDNNVLKILLVIFIVFIPLYPKLPMIDIEYTYIYIRFEDFFVSLLCFVYFIQLLRKKVVITNKMWIPIALFWIAVMVSFLYGHKILRTIEVGYIGFLHAARRIEYMLIFIIAVSLIKSKKDFLFYFRFILITLFVVAVYGIGQKLFGWPAVQTMNPEYARGYILYLTPEARISSTFAGHYDLASYTVFLIPIVISFYLLKNKLSYFFLFVLSLIVVVFTASRVSYIAYIASIFPFLIFKKKPKLLLVVLVLTVIFTLASNNLTSRLKRTFQVKRILVNEKTGEIYIPQTITSKELPAGSFYVKTKNQTGDDFNAYKESVIKEKEKELKKKGITLTNKERTDLIASLSSQLKPINTVLSDISVATRLQVEWPRAIKAFLFSPLLGTGPSSLTEATDNDYLRWLGEFGLLGTTIFIFILVSIGLTILKKARENDKYWSSLLWGYLFGLGALMINASYIDVFEASKVAFVFWLTTGIFVGLCQLNLKTSRS